MVFIEWFSLNFIEWLKSILSSRRIVWDGLLQLCIVYIFFSKDQANDYGIVEILKSLTNFMI